MNSIFTSNRSIVLTCLLLTFFSFRSTAVAQANCGFLEVNISNVSCRVPQNDFEITLQISKAENAPLVGNISVVSSSNSFNTVIVPDQDNQVLIVTLSDEDLSSDIDLFYSFVPDCIFSLNELFANPIGCGSIHGQVWNDANYDGLQQPEEAGIPDITVKLLTCEGDEILQKTTDAVGNYQFPFFPEGDYQIMVELPNDGGFYEFSKRIGGLDDPNNSDVTIAGLSDCVSLGNEDATIIRDAGLISCPPLTSLICGDRLNVSLNQNNCTFQVTPNLIVSGNIPCFSTLEVRLFDDSGFIGNVLTEDQVGKTVTAFVVDVLSETVCSAEIVVNDVTAPTIDCTSEVDMLTRSEQVQFIAGQIDGTQPAYTPADLSCWLNLDVPLIDHGDPLNYSTTPFTVDKSGFYRLVLFTDFGGGAGAIVDGLVDPFNPCMNLIKSETSFIVDFNLDYFDAFDLVGTSFVTAGMSPVMEFSLPLAGGREYQLLTANVISGVWGNFSWVIIPEGDGHLLDEENSAFPAVEGPVQFDLLCTDLDSIFGVTAYIGMVELPLATDNCGGEPLLTFTDTPGRMSVCGPSVIEREFSATDISGNTGICDQKITIRKPQKADIELPPNVIYLDCEDEIIYDENGHPDPVTSGYPYIWTAFGVQRIGSNYCNVASSYEDQIRLDLCESGYTIVREWNIFNWCNLADKMKFTQYINIVDGTPPIIDLTGLISNSYRYPDTFRYSTEAFTCTGNFQIPLPQITDGCGVNNTLVVEILAARNVPIVDNGVTVGSYLDTLVEATITAEDGWVAARIPQGCYWYRYIATDDCGNSASETHPFCVEDIIAPVAVCGNQMTVSIGGEGLGRIFVQNIDQGSFDACGIAEMKVRRADGDNPDCPNGGGDGVFRDFVDFACCDVGSVIEVELRVTDIFGNINSCYVDITVEDKITPICSPPEDLTISCNALPASFDATSISSLQTNFGEPGGLDNCVIAGFDELEPIVELDNCGAGRIVRSFQVYDAAGNRSSVCTQAIDITPEFNYEIKFPADRTITCDIPTNDSVLINNRACELMAIRVNDEVFEREPDACFKIFRTYTVINWCEYEDLSNPVVLARDEDCNGLVGDQDVWVLRRPDGSFIDGDNNENNNFPAANTKNTNCDGSTNPTGYWRTATSNGYWQYTQVIKVIDDTPPAIEMENLDPFCSLDNENCRAEVAIDFTVVEACSPNGIQFEVLLDQGADGSIDQVLDNALSGTFPEYTIQGTYPIGVHSIRILFEDGCGNNAVADIPFEVVDCKAPGLICNLGLTTALTALPEPIDIDGDENLDRGAAVLYAEDFVSDSDLDCTGEVIFTINRAGEVSNPTQDSIVIVCADSSLVDVEIVAWDNAFNPYRIQPDSTIGGPNYTKCPSTIIITPDEFYFCASIDGAISGAIKTTDDRRMANVEVFLSGEITQSQTTSPTGNYSFTELYETYNYEITPTHNLDHRNGVTTFDLILITKHILGVDPFDSPYERIAADANNSQTISTLDIIQFRKLILGIENELSSNTSWRFIAANYVFPITDNPWFEPFPESVAFKNLEGKNPDINFVAVKIGDVNQSVSLLSFGGYEAVDTRTAPTAFLKTADQSFETGAVLNIPIYIEEVADLEGFQFGLSLDPSALEIVAIENGILGQENIGITYQDRGILTASWFQMDDDISLGAPLLEIKAKAKSSGTLSRHLAMHEPITKPEYYLKNRGIGKLGISVGAAPSDFQVQIFPNPVKDAAHLMVEVPASGRIHVDVWDVLGRKVYEEGMQVEEGLNKTFLNTKTLPLGILKVKVFFEGRWKTISIINVN